MLIEGEKYTFNFTAAEAACLNLNATIATQAQMEQALQMGLETCKFGWISEKIAVIPRLSSDEKCGRGKTGLATWAANLQKKFAVFCFNASALEELKERSNGSTVRPPTSILSLTLVTQTGTFTPSVISTTRTPTTTKKLATTKSFTQKPFTSTFDEQLKIKRPTKTSDAQPFKPSPTINPIILPHFITSRPTLVSFFFSSTEVFSKPALSPSVSSEEHSLGTIATTLIIIGVIVLVLTVSGAVWYYKMYIFPCGLEGQQMDDIETEMWKHTGSELDLQNQPGTEEDEEEEESQRKYSSDITLCVNPTITANSLD